MNNERYEYEWVYVMSYSTTSPSAIHINDKAKLGWKVVPGVVVRGFVLMEKEKNEE